MSSVALARRGYATAVCFIRYLRDFFTIRVLCFVVLRRFLRAVRSSFRRPMIERAIVNLAANVS